MQTEIELQNNLSRIITSPIVLKVLSVESCECGSWDGDASASNAAFTMRFLSVLDNANQDFNTSSRTHTHRVFFSTV